MSGRGLIDLKSSAILKLIKIVKDASKIREIFGICGDIFPLKSDPSFLKIRRESRGVGIYCPIAEKLKIIEEVERRHASSSYLNIGNVKNGELMILFEFLPNEKEIKNPQQQLLLSKICNIFLTMVKSFNFPTHYKRIFFKDNKIVENNLISWLLILFKKYEDTDAKEKTGIILAHFHRFPNYPLLERTAVILLPILMNFSLPSPSKPLSSEEKEKNALKTNSLCRMSENEYNKTLLIDKNLVSSLIPLISNLDVESCWCINSLSRTSSLEHKNKIVSTPGFLPAVANMLSNLLKEETDDANYRFRVYKCVGVVVEGLSLCCGTRAAGSDEGDDCVLASVNDSALRSLESQGIPSLVLHVLSEELSNFDPERIEVKAFMRISAHSLPCLFASSALRSDAAVQTAIAHAADLCVNSTVSDSVNSIALQCLLRIGDSSLLTRLLTPANAGKLMKNLYKDMDKFRLNVRYCNDDMYEGISLLNRLCASGSAAGSPSEPNVLLPAFVEEGGRGVKKGGGADAEKLNFNAEMKALLEIEKIARQCAARGTDGGDEDDLRRCCKIRDKASFCVFHLMKSQQVLPSSAMAAVLQYATAVLEREQRV